MVSSNHHHPPPPPPLPPPPENSKALLAAVISLSAVVAFVVVLHIYARWFLRRRPPPPHTFRGGILGDSGGGLDASAIASLPVSIHKSSDSGAGGCWCAVCLGELEDGDVGRALPKCGHVFHVGCIDRWLLSRSSCPVCRAAVVVAVADNGVVESGRVSSSSLSSSSSSSSTTTIAATAGGVLSRMLSKSSRQENKVFPSVVVQELGV
ncbi:RING-H2 finger protein ATL5 [Acorus gramineus]|uniref:RING-H2 finger protein ATL5 n=1 Tax=Acorus gramineus TaxID=55184 RepID=A0AAV9B3R6_ACOGR|nr:RING-H2 finger protein ATL5 [Acorus gramineus]